MTTTTAATARVFVRFTDNCTAKIMGIQTPDCVAPTTHYSLRYGGRHVGEYRSSGYPEYNVPTPPVVAEMLRWTETSNGSVGGRTAAIKRLVARVAEALPGHIINHQ
jgi:hypothetical protein